MQHLWKVWAWLLLLTMQGSSEGSILSKSNIEKCDRTTSKDMKCSQKIVVQLAVAAGKSAEEDEISATIDTVSNGSFTQSLQDPQIIRLSKSSNFNRQPYEEYRRVDKCKAEDCWDANLPEAKKKIYWGVCCLCGGNSHHRGMDAKCGAAKHDIAHLSRKGTRHCLKWHPQWFPTFIIGLATMEFNIYIDISVGYGNSVDEVTRKARGLQPYLSVARYGAVRSSINVDCPAGIQASPAVLMSLRPNEPKTQHFELNVESSNAETFNCSVRLRDSEGEVADALQAFVSVTATQFTNVTKLQSEGASLKLDRLHNGGGYLGILGNALGGVFGFTKTIASNLTGALARLGIGLITSIFGPNIGALIEGFFHGASSLMDWILGGFGIGNILGSGPCNCASDYDILCILANFCFAKIIGLLGCLLVLVGVALSLVLLQRMGALGLLGRCVGHFCLLPFQMCKNEDRESDDEEDMPTNKPSYNMKELYHPQIVSMQAKNVVPWTMMPPQAPYRYGYQ